MSQTYLEYFYFLIFFLYEKRKAGACARIELPVTKLDGEDVQNTKSGRSMRRPTYDLKVGNLARIKNILKNIKEIRTYF